jgi:hypothetical protein
LSGDLRKATKETLARITDLWEKDLNLGLLYTKQDSYALDFHVRYMGLWEQ